ncbi:MAG: PorP/SprF family type IX secretion system membrane protein [Bacteroidia bacterium]|nr:PorP/SprF family type IX secretion system membrane protein [Bacteroidia bacterium]
MKRHLPVFLLLGTFLFSSYFELVAQDPIFSQYFANPMYLNPALTGMYGGTHITLNGQKMRYKAGDFLTNSAAISTDVHCIQSAFGLIYSDDRAGDAPVKWQRMGASWAWHARPMDKMDYPWDLRLGLNGTYNRRSLDLDRLVFSDQLHAIYGNQGPSAVDLSAFGGDNSFFDLDFGADFSSNIKETFYFNTGFAVNHLMRVDPSLININDTLPVRFTGYFQGSLEMENGPRDYWLIPFAKMDMQRSSRQWTSQDTTTNTRILFPAAFIYRLNYGVLFAMRPGTRNGQNVGFWGGFMMGHSVNGSLNQNINTFTPMVGFTWSGGAADYRFGMSYDYDFSGPRSDTGGIFEISLMMTIPEASFFCSSGTQMMRRRCPVPGMPSSSFSASPRNRIKYK